MAKTVQLDVEAAFDASKAADGFDDIGNAAKGMANDVDAAAKDIDSSASRIDNVAASADNLGSSTSQAAGGLGDLGGALSAVPGPLGALGSGMESVAPLVMGVTGATDLLSLAMNSNIVVSVKQKAATIANAVATKATAAATKAYTVVQWAMNAALAANPIGLVVLALVALVAGVVLAYKKSETFRDIVNAAFGVAKTAVEAVVDVVKKVPEFISNIVEKAGNLGPAFGVAKDLIVGYFDLMTKPLQLVIDGVQKLIDLISKIDFPDIPDGIPFIGRTSSGGITGGLSSQLRGGLAVNVNGGFVGNEAQLGRVIKSAVAAELRRRGIR